LADFFLDSRVLMKERGRERGDDGGEREKE
jgi:hypothetical protein